MIDWSKFESPVHNSVIIDIFKKLTLNLIRPAANIIFNSHNSKQIKSITQSRLRLRHLLGTYSKHGFQDALYPVCHNRRYIKLLCVLPF